MNTELNSPESALRAAREALYQEWVHLQVVGRALTPDEERRSAALERAVPLLDEVLTILGEEGAPVQG